MSASMLLIARTILFCWRVSLEATAAPRGPWMPVASPAAGVHEFTAIRLLARSTK